MTTETRTRAPVGKEVANPPLELVSHALCPYVQRAVIVLTEKGIPHMRTYVDLGDTPPWFKEISPLGKVPLLRVGDEVLFESAVICEFLDESYGPRLHPENVLQRARHRAWMEFGSSLLESIWYFYSAKTASAFAEKTAELRRKFTTLEKQLGAGHYFAGADFSMVDVVFGPVFRYFDVFDTVADFGVLEGLPKTQAWRQALAGRASVIKAVSADYPRLLKEFLAKQGSELARCME